MTRAKANMTGLSGILTAAALAFLTVFPVDPARAELSVRITQGKAEPLPIAVPDLFGSGVAVDRSLGTRDRPRRRGQSRTLRPVSHDRSAGLHPEPVFARVRPQFPAWRQINAQALVVGSAEIRPDGRLRVEFRLWDVFAGQQLVGLRSETEPQNWRRIAHIIADAIYKRITGEEGYFDTRVVYVAESGPAKKRQAARHHGSGWRQSPLSHQRRRVCSDPALFAHRAGDYLSGLHRFRRARLHLQYRNGTPGDAGQFSQHDLRAALLAGREPGHHVDGAGWKFRRLIRWTFGPDRCAG